MPQTHTTSMIGLGGGCHWCTEAVFRALRGVETVDQGFICSIPPAEDFSEGVRLRFQDTLIPLQALLEVHLRTHASTSNHSFRSKYRSAVYVFSEQQQEQVARCLELLQKDFKAKLVTQVLPFQEFKPSNERYHQYYENRTSEQFCTRYIDPKLELLRKHYKQFLNT